MDDLLIFLVALFCGNTTGQNPDSVLLSLFQGAGATTVACVDPDERVGAAYPRLVISAAEGEQHQTGDAQAKFFAGSVRLEIVTRQSDSVPDELDLLDQLKARVTDLLLGNPSQNILPIQGQVFTVASSSYNVSVFYQCRPTGRLPAEDPTIKRWGGTYRVTLCRLGF